MTGRPQHLPMPNEHTPGQRKRDCALVHLDGRHDFVSFDSPAVFLGLFNRLKFESISFDSLFQLIHLVTR